MTRHVPLPHFTQTSAASSFILGVIACLGCAGPSAPTRQHVPIQPLDGTTPQVASTFRSDAGPAAANQAVHKEPDKDSDPYGRFQGAAGRPKEPHRKSEQAREQDANVGRGKRIVGSAGKSEDNEAVDEAQEHRKNHQRSNFLGSVGYFTWIYAKPRRSRHPIGLVRPGSSVVLAESQPVSGPGCPTHRWYRIVPTGFVCEDSTVVLDPNDSVYAALRQSTTPRTGPLPYRYAFSLGAPMYGRFPTDDETKRQEARYPALEKLKRKRKPRSGYEELTTAPVLVGHDPLPPFAGPQGLLPRMKGYGHGLIRKQIPVGSLLAFSRAVQHRGRTFLLTTDLTWVPADRVKVFRETQFHGVKFGPQTPAPKRMGWTRHKSVTKWKLDASVKKLVRSGDAWPPRSFIVLTGKRRLQRGRTFFETTDHQMWIRHRDMVHVPPVKRLPLGVKKDELWIRFSVSRGTFELLRGNKIVFSTLASPGRGGPPPKAHMSLDELVEGSHTPMGVFRITYKTVATTMSHEPTPYPRKHWIQDVPWTMYFRRPFAIHAAYWHEDFGYPKSGGCVNLSPSDAMYVFSQIAPRLPEHWSGVSSSPQMGKGTIVWIRR